MRSLLLPSLAVSATLATAPAAIVYDSITGASIGGSSTNITGPLTAINLFGTPIPFPDNQVAVRFETGAYPATIDQLDFVLNISNPAHLDPVSVTISSGPSTPGGVGLVPLGSATPTGATNPETLTIIPSSPINLAANSQYWLHFTAVGLEPFYSLGYAFGAPATTHWTLTDAWTYQPQTSTTWSSVSGPSPAIRIHGTETIPEPSLTLLGGLGWMLLLRRRRG